MTDKEYIRKQAKHYALVYKISFGVMIAALLIVAFIIKYTANLFMPSLALILSVLFYGAIWLRKIKQYSRPVEEMDERTLAELAPDMTASLFGIIMMGVIFLALTVLGIMLISLSTVGGTSLGMMIVGIFLLVLATFALGVMLPWVIKLPVAARASKNKKQ